MMNYGANALGAAVNWLRITVVPTKYAPWWTRKLCYQDTARKVASQQGPILWVYPIGHLVRAALSAHEQRPMADKG